jgi:hypothetical protein
MYQRYIWWSLLAGSIVAALVGVLGTAAWHTAPGRDFERAREHWEAQPIERYRLIIDRPPINCKQDVEVRNERIVRVLTDTCPIRLLTVEDLFDRIAMLDGLDTERFSPSGVCACSSVLNAEVMYHPDLGYPVRVGITDRRTLDWSKQACWRHMLREGGLPECDASFIASKPRITEISLIPLP